MKKIKESCSLPCTVKCRLGVDHFDSYEFVQNKTQTIDKVKEISSEGNSNLFSKIKISIIKYFRFKCVKFLFASRIIIY